MTYSHKIKVLKYGNIIDDIGNVDRKLVKEFDVWARINGTSGRVFYEASQTNTQNYITFWVRYSKSNVIDQCDHIVYNNRVYVVKHVNDYMEQHLELEVKADEVI